MSVAMLQAEITSAAQLLDFNPEELALLEARTRLVTHNLGEYVVGNEVVHAQRIHSGNTSFNGYAHPPVARGGVRLDNDPGYDETNNMLALDMTLKLAARGHTTPDPAHGNIYFCGGKGFQVANARRLGPQGIAISMRRYAERMHNAGLARHDVDGIAGDMNTNGFSDVYATTVNVVNRGEYPYWQATASGKSVGNGGLSFRPAATGFGVYAAERALMEIQGEKGVRTVALQGLGNVAGHYARFASEDDQLVLQWMSDSDGTIWTPSPEGFTVTPEMVAAISDNPQTIGRRAELYFRTLREEHRQKFGRDMDIRFEADPGRIISAPADHFVPAACKYTVNQCNIGQFGAQTAVIEAANDPLDKTALTYCQAAGIEVVSGSIANSGGTDVSIKEIKLNIAQADAPAGDVVPTPSWHNVRDELAASTHKLVREVADIRAKVPEIATFREAAGVLSVQNLVRYQS